MTQGDVLYRFRLRTMALAEELGNVWAACRITGIHHSTFYRWRRKMRRYGVEILRPRERRHPRMPNQPGPRGGGRVFALHTCAITLSGSVHCWGADGFGQLGVLGVSISVEPLLVEIA